MPKIFVTDREGERHEVDATPHAPLMESLRDLPYGVEAICGGMCSCATCHCYIDEASLTKLAPRGDEESELLDELEHSNASSRLTCQVEVSEDLEGLELTIAPFE